MNGIPQSAKLIDPKYQGVDVVDFFAQHTGRSRSDIKRVKKEGGLSLNSENLRNSENMVLHDNDVVRCGKRWTKKIQLTNYWERWEDEDNIYAKYHESEAAII